MSMFQMPCSPYPVQQQFSEFIQCSLEDNTTPSTTLMMELPTGCGKTLAALSPVLAFQESLGNIKSARAFFGKNVNQRNKAKGSNEDESWTLPSSFFEKFGCTTSAARKRSRALPSRQPRSDASTSPPPCTIFFVCRTHAQLTQAVAELQKFEKNAAAAPRAKPLTMTILGSRDKYCICPIVSNARSKSLLPNEGNNLGEICDKLVALGQCELVNRSSELGGRAMGGALRGGHCKSLNLWEIEDLVKDGVAIQGCPYYASRNIVASVDVVFATYEYLLDPLIRHETKLEGALANHSIIVIDEAHNVPDVCQDALSAQFSSSVLAAAATEIVRFTSNPPPDSSNILSYPRSFAISQFTLSQLIDFLHTFIVGIGDAMSTVTSNADIVPQQLLMQLASATACGDLSHFEKMFNAAFRIIMSLGVTFNPFDISIFTLSQLKRLLLITRFMLKCPASFALWVEQMAMDRSKLGDESPGKALHIRCLDGGLGFTHLSERSYRTILMSGTISPLSSFAAALRVSIVQPSSSCFEGDHVVDVARQSRIVALAASASGSDSPCCKLRCTLQNYLSSDFLDVLAHTISEVVLQSRFTGGALVFLPNYQLCEKMFNLVKALLRSHRGVFAFLEPRNSSDFRNVFAQYKTSACGGNVAVFFAVYRGKLSEGLDFVDDMARMVICVGIPFRSLVDENVRRQRLFSGEDWYLCDAMRCLNQSIGRCLRHRNDFGSMVLLDDRLAFGHSRQKPTCCLSKWVRESIMSFDSLHPMVSTLQEFFDQKCQNAAEAAPKIVRHPLAATAKNNVIPLRDRDVIAPQKCVAARCSGMEGGISRRSLYYSTPVPSCTVDESSTASLSVDVEQFNVQLCADVARKLTAEADFPPSFAHDLSTELLLYVSDCWESNESVAPVSESVLFRGNSSQHCRGELQYT